jgi:hypothetical protein
MPIVVFVEQNNRHSQACKIKGGSSMRIGLSLSLFIVLSLHCFGQDVQRMGILGSQSIQIMPGSTERVKSVCLDEHKAAPLSTTPFTRVLGNDGRHVVREGLKRMSLSDALRSSAISIHGAGNGEIGYLRIKNHTQQVIGLNTTQLIPIGISGHRPFEYDITPIASYDNQEDIWQWQAEREARMTIDTFSDDTLHVGAIFLRTNGVDITLPNETIHISAEELELIVRGEQLNSRHSLSRRMKDTKHIPLIIYKHARMRKYNNYLSIVDLIVYGMGKAYPDALLFREPLNETTTDRVKAIAGMRARGSDKVSIMMAEKGFAVVDWNVIQDIKPALIEHGFTSDSFTVVKPGVDVSLTEDGRVVVVITGHINEALETFIDELGRAGVFKNNYIILNTCNQRPTRGLTERVCEKYGAIGVFSFQGDEHGKIYAHAVADYLVDLAKELKKRRKHNLYHLLHRLIRKHGLNGIWTVDVPAPERSTHNAA